jgi:hypothetical protein
MAVKQGAAIGLSGVGGGWWPVGRAEWAVMPWMGRGNVLEIACSPANAQQHRGVAARQLCLSNSRKWSKQCPGGPAMRCPLIAAVGSAPSCVSLSPA